MPRRTGCGTIEDAGWLAYCRCISKGGSQEARKAQVCVDLGKQHPSKAKRKLADMLRSGRIDQETHDYRIECVDHLTELQTEGYHTHAVPIDAAGWASMGEGRHVRLRHLGEG